jgi:hypothetical protein
MRLFCFLWVCWLCNVAFAECTSSNIGVYDSKGVLVSSHTQTYKANEAAILISQAQGKATIKTPDIVCTSKVQSSTSSSVRSSSSAQSSSAPVQAGSLRVSKSGSDSGDCISSACLTIQYAVNKLKPGNTLIVGAGTYSATSQGSSNPCYFFGAYGTVCITVSGTQSAPITIIGEDGAVIDGQGVQSGILLNSHDHWIIKNIDFVNVRKYAIANQSQAGNDVPNDALLSKNVTIESCNIDGVTTNEAGDNIGGIGPWSSQDWVIRNNTIKNVTGGSGIRAYGVINALVEGNDISNVSEGILWKDHFVTADRGLVFESEIRNNTISAKTYGVRIQIRGTGTPEAGNNFIHHNTFTGFTSSDSAGISVAMYEAKNQSGYLHIDSNVIDCNGASGCAAVSVDASSDLRITNNIFRKAQIGISAIKLHATKKPFLNAANGNTYDQVAYAAVMDRYGGTVNYRTLAEWKAATNAQSDTLNFDNPEK